MFLLILSIYQSPEQEFEWALTHQLYDVVTNNKPAWRTLECPTLYLLTHIFDLAGVSAEVVKILHFNSQMCHMGY